MKHLKRFIPILLALLIISAPVFAETIEPKGSFLMSSFTERYFYVQKGVDRMADLIYKTKDGQTQTVVNTPEGRAAAAQLGWSPSAPTPSGGPISMIGANGQVTTQNNLSGLSMVDASGKVSPVNPSTGFVAMGASGQQVRYADQPAPVSTQEDLLRQMADQQRKSRVAALDTMLSGNKANLQNSLNNSLTNLTTEQSNIAPMYYDKRNQAQGQSDVGAMNFAQYMASRGIKGNAGAMPEIYRNAGLQGQLGALNQQEAQANTGIENQRANLNTEYNTNLASVNNAYNADVTNANADVESQLMQGLINQISANKAQANADRLYNFQVGQATGSIGGTPTLEATKMTQDQSNADRAFAQSVKQYEQNFTESQRQWNTQFTFDQKKQSFTERQAQINNAVQQGQLSNQEAAQQLARDKFAADTDPTSIDNKLKQSQIDQNTAETTNLSSGLTASGGAPAGTTPTQTEVSNHVAASAIAELDKLTNLDSQKTWLQQHRAEIIQTAGLGTYNDLMALYGAY